MRPRKWNARLADALALHRAGDRAAAEPTYRALLARDARDADVLYLLGECRLTAGDPAEAALLFRRAATVTPGDAATWTGLGRALAARQDPAALQAFERAIEADPKLADARLGRAQILIASDRTEEGLSDLDTLLLRGVDGAPVQNARGFALRALHRLPEALAAYDAALALDPTCVRSRIGRAHVLSDLGQDVEALTEVVVTLALDAAYLPARSAHGVLLRRLGKPAAALEVLDGVLRDAPEEEAALSARASCLSDLDRHEEALAAADRLIGDPAASTPASRRGEGWNARANTLSELGRFEEALECLDRAAETHEGNPNIAYNRGNALRGLNRHAEAVAAFTEARRIKPDFVDAEWNESLCRLALGDYGAGLTAYEARWRRRNHPPPRHAAAPLWRGEDPTGRTLLFHAEQGLGDTIQMARYVALAAARGARVVLEVQRPLVSLLRGMPGVAEVVGVGDAVPPHDLQCPIMSLPLAFGTRADAIPAAIPYLAADPERVSAWDRALPRGVLRLGLVCSGNAVHVGDRQRSVPLAAFVPLLVPGVAAFLVQTEVRAADAAFLAADGRITPLAPRLADFRDTAAVLSVLDAVVAVDTSVAHLAGALGRPVHMLVPNLADWRWMLDRTDSPWYPTMRLHRRGRTEAWDDVIARVATDLFPLRLAA